MSDIHRREDSGAGRGWGRFLLLGGLLIALGLIFLHRAEGSPTRGE